MYHSITFGSKNTWDDWHIVPSSRPVFDPPKVKTKTMDIQGKNGSLDLSEALTGYPVFNNREGSFEFIVLNDYNKWNELYSAISDYLHGRVMRAVLEDDPEYYYEGRFSVNKWKSDKNYSTISIDYSVFPYKRKLLKSEMTLNVLAANNSKTISSSFYGTEPVCPEITVDCTLNVVSLRFENSTLGIDHSRYLSNGTHKLPEIIFYGDSVSVTMRAIGTDISLQDSNGEAMLDNSGDALTGTNCASVNLSCVYGRL